MRVDGVLILSLTRDWLQTDSVCSDFVSYCETPPETRAVDSKSKPIAYSMARLQPIGLCFRGLLGLSGK